MKGGFIQGFKNKDLKIFLTNNYCYNGQIKEFDSENNLILFEDKYNGDIVIHSTRISAIKENRDVLQPFSVLRQHMNEFELRSYIREHVPSHSLNVNLKNLNIAELIFFIEQNKLYKEYTEGKNENRN